MYHVLVVKVIWNHYTSSYEWSSFYFIFEQLQSLSWCQGLKALQPSSPVYPLYLAPCLPDSFNMKCCLYKKKKGPISDFVTNWDRYRTYVASHRRLWKQHFLIIRCHTEEQAKVKDGLLWILGKIISKKKKRVKNKWFCTNYIYNVSHVIYIFDAHFF